MRKHGGICYHEFRAPFRLTSRCERTLKNTNEWRGTLYNTNLVVCKSNMEIPMNLVLIWMAGCKLFWLDGTVVHSTKRVLACMVVCCHRTFQRFDGEYHNANSLKDVLRLSLFFTRDTLFSLSLSQTHRRTHARVTQQLQCERKT